MSRTAPPDGPVSPHGAPLPTVEQLPDDPATLKRMIVELLTTLHEERRDREQLQQRLHLLLERLYGRKSERFDSQQPLLFADGPAAVEDASAGQAAAPDQPGDAGDAPATKRRHQGHGRRRLPDDLPHRDVHHELTEAERVCVCGTTRLDIGVEDGGQQLDWQPASYFVWQHWMHKYLCPHCAGLAEQAKTPADEPVAAEPSPDASVAVAVPPAAHAPGSPPPPLGPAIIAAAKPPMPIAKGLPGPGLLAHIIVSKYFDHLPLYRQESISERQGVLIPRSTSCAWMAACAERLRPLYQRMVQEVVQSRWLHTDDTPVKNLDHAPGTTDKARFWIYWGDRDHPYNVFDFTVNRQRDGPATFLADFHGYLQADAFSGYDALYLPDPRAGSAPIVEVACNAHARRKFHEARHSDAARSHQALAYYAQLYDLERAATAGNFDDQQRLAMRQQFAVPILEKFKTWLDQERTQVLPKSPLAEAIGYARNNWSALVRYTEQGFLAIDNNVAEREMKRIAIGRKNWLFVGSANGGRTAAVLFSFTSTCQRLKIDPWAYLQDVLGRLPRTAPEQWTELLPDRWQSARQAAAAAAAAPPPPAADSTG